MKQLSPWWESSACTNCYLLDRLDHGDIDEAHAIEVIKTIQARFPYLPLVLGPRIIEAPAALGQESPIGASSSVAGRRLPARSVQKKPAKAGKSSR